MYCKLEESLTRIHGQVEIPERTMTNFTSINNRLLDIAASEYTNALPIEFWLAVAEALDEPEHHESSLKTEKGRADAVVLVSGGLDSTYAYWRALQKHQSVLGVYIDFGQSYAQTEQKALSNLDIPFEVRKFNIYQGKGDWKHILPLRNLIALNLASFIAGKGGQIYFGVVNGENPERGGDKSKYFIELCQSLFKKLYGINGITILNDCTKADIVNHYMRETGDYHFLLKTVSCYSTKNGEQCGRCQACLRRYIAFKYNQIPEDEILSNYEINPLQGATEAIEKYTAIMVKELTNPGSTKYSKRRAIQTLSVIAPGNLETLKNKGVLHD